MSPLRLRLSVDAFIDEYCRDYALDGITLEASAPVPIGTEFDLVVEFDAQKGFRSQAEVVPCAQAGRIALKFKNTPAAYRAWLDQCIESRKTQAGGHQLQKAVAGRALSGASDVLGETDLTSEPVLGIDLGTCNSAACYVKDGKPIVIDLRDANDTRTGVHSLPSVVAFTEDGRELVGVAAQNQLLTNPRGTVFGAKRFIGLTYDSPNVQKMLARFPYKIVRGGNGRCAVNIKNRPLQLTAVSARILTVIRDRAEKQLGIAFQHAVITVPAYYNDNQRDAVVQAGRLAGLTVQRILNEPTAAAIAYGLTSVQKRRLLVYDLGGGTFDVSIMSVDHNQLTVLATAGDTFLGGEDFDDAIVKLACSEFTRKTGKQISQNNTALAPIKQQAELAKRRLSTHTRTMLVVKDVLLVDRTTAKLDIELDRAAVEKLIEPLVARTLKICDMALQEAKIDKSQLGDLLLVGGQTLMPYVKQRVREHLEIAPRSDLNPDEVVALGAGMFPALAASGTQLKDVLSMSIGVEVTGRMKVMIPRNTQVPCVQRVSLPVPLDQFATYKLEVWQGDDPALSQNEHLGTLKVDAVAPGNENPVPLRIEFILTADCLLKVRVTHAKTEEAQEVILRTRDSL